LKPFGQHDIVTTTRKSVKLEEERHNKSVEENRQYLKQLTNGVLYLRK